MKDKLIDGKKIVTIFKGKLVKMIKDANSRLDDYSISPKIRQIFFHWGYELTEIDLLGFCFLKFQYFCFVKKRFCYFFVNIEMNYYWFNRQELLQKAQKN